MNLRANEPDYLVIENQLKQWIEDLGHCDLSDSLILSLLAARQARKDAEAEWSQRGNPAEGFTMRSVTHKTGYLYHAEAYEGDAVWYRGCESWHRTYKGAQRAKARNGDRGSVYWLTGDDTSYKVQA